MRRGGLPGRQSGIVMFVALVMLVLMLLMAAASFNMGRQNAIIAGNMQHKAQAMSSANMTVEQVVSSARFIDSPANALVDGCGTNQACYDVNGDGTTDVTVVLSPAPCIKKVQIIKNAELSINNPNDVVCMTGVAQNLGVEGASTGNSLCANTVWEINAAATDDVTGAASTVSAGFAVRVAADTALDATKICP